MEFVVEYFIKKNPCIILEGISIKTRKGKFLMEFLEELVVEFAVTFLVKFPEKISCGIP